MQQQWQCLVAVFDQSVVRAAAVAMPRGCVRSVSSACSSSGNASCMAVFDQSVARATAVAMPRGCIRSVPRAAEVAMPRGCDAQTVERHRIRKITTQ